MSTPFLFTPVYRAFDASGEPLAGGQLFTYSAGTTTPKQTFSDAAGTVPNANPVILDSTGSATVRLDVGAYHLVQKDATGTNTLSDADYYAAPYLSQSDLGTLLYPQTAAEVTAGVVPVNIWYKPGDIRRHGAVLDGATDDTTAVQNWASVGGSLSFPVAQTALISAEIPLVSNTTITGTQGAGFTWATHDIACFRATSKVNIEVHGLTFTQTSAGTLGAYTIGGIVFDRCANCRAENNTFVGCQWSGLLVLASTRCVVKGNTITAMLGAIQDASDISVISNNSLGSAYNLIDGNFCYGGGEHGIACWDPYSGTLPTRNTISNNFIGAHTGYGILHYMPNAGDSFNKIIGNVIESIAGSWLDIVNNNHPTGAGIYCVGQGAGGLAIIGNTVRNCCISTDVASLAPAGIGISGTVANSVPIVVSGNTVEGMTQYHGILLTGVLGGASVTGNTIRHPASNTTGDLIRVVNSANVAVNSNTLNNLNTTTAQRNILFLASGSAATCIECSCVGNIIIGGHQSYIETVATGSSTPLVSGLTISGNNCSGGDNTCIPLLLNTSSCADVMVTGNYFFGGSSYVVTQDTCTNVVYTGNKVKGTGTVILNFINANTGSFYDKSNVGSGIGAGVNNAGTGLVIHQLGTSAPSGAGVWARGDHIINSATTSGSHPGWYCITAGGSGGTFQAEAVIA